MDPAREEILANFPHRWDPFFAPVMTVNDLYAYPTKHFDFHGLQLSLKRPGALPDAPPGAGRG